MNDRIIDKDVLNKLQVIAKSLNEKKEYLVQLDNEILQKCTLDEIDEEVDESTDVSTRINEFIAKITDYVTSSSAALKPPNASPRPISPLEVLRPLSRAVTPPRPAIRNELYEYPDVQNTSINGRTQAVRLPKISLPRFKGDVTKFQHFGKAFDAQWMRIKVFQIYIS